MTEYRNTPRRGSSTSGRSNVSGRTTYRGQGGNRSGSSYSGGRGSSGGYRRKKRRKKNGSALLIAYLLRILCLAAALLILFFAVKGIAGLVKGRPADNESEVETEAATEPETTTEPETESPDPNIVFSNGRELDLRKPMVALTYDDGPYASVGNQLMDDLAKVNGRATFFMVGNRIEQFKDEVVRMAQEGHELANHSFDHNEKLSKQGIDVIQWEFSACNDAIAAATGVTPAVMRLPGGIISDNVRQAVTMPMISWSVDTRDWKTRNAQATIDAILGHVTDGDIVLMHELYQSTADASHVVIPELVNQGFQLVTVSELIAFRGPGSPDALERGKQYTDFYPQNWQAAAPAPEAEAAASSEGSAEAQGSGDAQAEGSGEMQPEAETVGDA